MSLLCHDRKDLFLYRCWSQLHTHRTQDYTSICKWRAWNFKNDTAHFINTMFCCREQERKNEREKEWVTWILLSMLGLKMYMPALILLDTKTCGFSTKRSILPLSALNTTTPYFEGSSTRVTFKHTVQYKLEKNPYDLINPERCLNFKGLFLPLFYCSIGFICQNTSKVLHQFIIINI